MSSGDHYDEVMDNLETLEEMSESSEKRQVIQDTRALVRHAASPRVFGRVVKGFGRRDVIEAFFGSLIFGFPMLVEGGTLEIGAHLAGHPLLFVGTYLFGIAIVVGILYATDLQDVRVVNPILGVIPRRVVGIVSVSFLTALVLMTAWGRVDWTMPWIALNQVMVTFVVMALGASLGDILPGT